MVATLEAALEEARVGDSAAREAKVAAERDFEAAKTALARAERAVETTAQALRDALARHGFDTHEAYLAAHMTDEELTAAEAEVAGHAEALNETKGDLRQARATAKKHPPRGDVDHLEASWRVAEEAAEAAREVKAEADSLVRSLEATRKALDDLDREFKDVEARYAVVGRLADVAAGQGGGAKVSFQRWVLGAYLDEVLVAASRRLLTMSKGRFRLERQRAASDFRRASGLDLAVFDSWVNRARPAVTLSGGESFLAALALALGLAETVQERAGGTRLETIFVDEGFGALDQDALDLAMEALMELKDTGRLVGVITHVPELRQVIDARLEVRGGPGGSSTRFVVP